MSVNVAGLGGYEPPKLLVKGWYTAECIEAKETDYGSLQITFSLIDGPDQDEEGTPTPAGKKLVQFLTVDLSKAKSDKHARFMIGQIGRTLTAFGMEIDGDELDYEQFVGRTVELNIKSQKDNNDIMRDTIVHMRPVE
jgi:hypothetical protein